MKNSKQTYFGILFSILLLGIFTQLLTNDMLVMAKDIDYTRENEDLEELADPILLAETCDFNVYVYDSITLEPLMGVRADLFTMGGLFLETRYTDSGGHINFTNLDRAIDYCIPLDKAYYYDNIIDWIDPNFWPEDDIIYLECALEPIIKTLEILTPINGETVEGGLVFIDIGIEDPGHVDYIDVYVNSINITKFEGYMINGEFAVPIYNNGTNTISVECLWTNNIHKSTDSIAINSVNVMPIVNIKEGDTLSYKYETLTNTNVTNFYFTFEEWLDPFTMKTQVYLHTYNESGTIDEMEYYIEVNVLTGYVSADLTMQFLNQKLFAFGGLLPSSQIGDKAIWTQWDELLLVNESLSWQYTDVWTLDYLTTSNSTAFIEKSSNLLYYFLIPDQIRVTLIETSIDFTSPNLLDVADIQFATGDKGNSIIWSATDMNPRNYTIYLASFKIADSVLWESEVPIVIDVDGLSVGTYTFRIIVEDLAGNTAEDIVIVTVTPVIHEFNAIFSLTLIYVLVFVTILVVIKKRKRRGNLSLA